MIFTAERSRYFVQRAVGHGTAEEHGQLPRFRDVFRSSVGSEVTYAYVKISGYSALDDVQGNVLVGNVFLHAFLRQLDGNGLVLDGSVDPQPCEHAFDLPDMILDLAGEERADVVIDLETAVLAFFLYDGLARLKIRRLNVGDHAPLETGDEPVADVLQFPGRLIAGHDDLAVVGEEILEELEELVLSAVHQREMLHIVDQNDVVVGAVFFPELMHVVLEGKGSLEIGAEVLAGDVEDPFAVVPFVNGVADRVHKVCFAKSRAAVDEERIVGSSGIVGHVVSGSVSVLVRRTDYEIGENVIAVQFRRLLGAQNFFAAFFFFRSRTCDALFFRFAVDDNFQSDRRSRFLREIVLDEGTQVLLHVLRGQSVVGTNRKEAFRKTHRFNRREESREHHWIGRLFYQLQDFLPHSLIIVHEKTLHEILLHGG